mgnify:CR=1 FL=1
MGKRRDALQEKEDRRQKRQAKKDADALKAAQTNEYVNSSLEGKMRIKDSEISNLKQEITTLRASYEAAYAKRKNSKETKALKKQLDEAELNKQTSGRNDLNE